MRLASTVTTNLSPALALQDGVHCGLGVDEEGLSTGLVGAEQGLQALLAILDAEQSFKAALNSGIMLP